MHKKYLAFVILALILTGCAKPAPYPKEISDIITLDQRPSHYVTQASADVPLIAPETADRLRAELVRKYYAPWHRDKPGFSSNDVMWGFNAYAKKPGFGENKLPRPGNWADLLKSLARMDDYPNTLRNAVTIRNTSLRVLPTMRPHFNDFTLAGEGFPFDNLQNSAVWVNTPLLITQTSSDGGWVLAESPFALGFIPVEDIAYVDDPATQASLESDRLLAIIADDTPVRSASDRFIARAHIGSLFPLAGETATEYVVTIPAASPNRHVIPLTGYIAKTKAAPMPLSPTPANISTIADAMSGQLYGWGGLFENRDCSAATRDILIPFGLWLERNSKAQAFNSGGRVIELHELDSTKKLDVIKAEGVPFLTLIYRPGHIMLYLGAPDGVPLIFHNVWGLRTITQDKKQGRHIIGRAVVTTLRPGMELPDIDPVKGDFLKAITAMTVFGQESAK